MHRLQGLNQVSAKYPYQLPLAPSAIEQLRNARIFTKLYLHSAYNLIHIRTGNEWKTAFNITSRHYQYQVKLYGLTCASSVFQCFINDVFHDFLGKFVIAYIDNILICSHSLEEHICHVTQVLKQLWKNELYDKGEKCEFHVSKVGFLGWVIDGEGVSMDQDKVKAVSNWPIPRILRSYSGS